MLLVLIVSFILAVFVGFNTNEKKNIEIKESQRKPIEIEAIILEKDLKKQVEIYEQLIERVGIEKAQEELYLSGLPFDGQTHLLNHTSGDWLYERYGNSGIIYCKDYFLSSCYHGFIIHVIGNEGMGGLNKVMEACWEKGSPTATQCAHAIGHGILANLGYKHLPQALEDCDKVSQTSPNFPLYNCHDGAFMENVWAVHEGKPSPDQWISQSDYFYPCNSPKINEKYKNACWSNQPSRMYIMFGGDLKRVGGVCFELKDSQHKTTCFDALARQIHPLTSGSVDKTFSMCSLMPSQEWIDKCIASIAKAAFSVGDRTTPFEICTKAENRNLCYTTLFGTLKAYALDNAQKLEFCNLVADQGFSAKCKNY